MSELKEVADAIIRAEGNGGWVPINRLETTTCIVWEGRPIARKFIAPRAWSRSLALMEPTRASETPQDPYGMLERQYKSLAAFGAITMGQFMGWGEE